MPGTPEKNTKEKSSTSKKKTKKDKESNSDTRSTSDSSVLPTIQENDPNRTPAAGYQFKTDTADSSGDERQDEDLSDRQLLFKMNDNIQQLHAMISANHDRIQDLELVNRSAKKLSYGPKNKKGSNKEKKDNKEKNKKKKKETPSLLASVLRSAQKQSWSQMMKEQDQQVQGGDDPDDEDGDSSSSDDSDSSSDSETQGRDTGDDLTDASGEAGSENNDGNNNNNNNPDKDEDERRTNNIKKGSLFKALEATTQKAAKTKIRVTRAEKECHITIKDFTLSHVCKAMKAIIRFQEVEGTVVNMAKVLSTHCTKHLKLKYALTNEDIHNMQIADLFSLMAKETVVHSKPKFYQQLREALDHIKLIDYKDVNPGNYETYYFQQLNLVEEFKIVFKIMLEENKDCCPNCDDKEYGLIRLFKSFHSHKYWSYAYATRKTLTYSRMDRFLDDYSETAMQLYSLAMINKEMPWYGTSDKKPYETKKEDFYHRRKREISASQLHAMHNERAHNLEEGDSYSDSGDDTWQLAEAEGYNTKHSYGEDEEDDLSEASNETEEEEDKDEKLVTSTVAAFADHKSSGKADKKDYPCLRKIMSGNCDRDDCPYGHRRDVLLKGASDMIGKLTAYQKSQAANTQQPSSGAATPYRVLQKDKYKKN
jgi:hypothetical protein